MALLTKIVVFAPAVLIAVYAALLILARFFSRPLVFPAPRPSYSRDEAGLFFIKTSDGLEIAAKFFENPKSDICVVYSHGNGEDVGEITPLMHEYCARGVNVLFYDYPSYGLSKGRASEAALKGAALAAYAYAKDNLHFADKNIVPVGYSLGSVAAVTMAEKNPECRGLVVIGGLANASKTVLPFDIIPWKMLENTERIERLKCPILFIHGTRDIVVPVRNARANFKAAGAQKRLVLFGGAGHYGLPQNPAYWSEIENFIENGIYEKSDSVLVR